MTEKTIAQILHRIQKELKAPKNNKNNFGNYSYRSAEDILEAVKKCLHEGEYVTCTDEVHLVGQRYYVKAIATLSAGGEKFIACEAFAREEETKKGMDAAQITGSASSYARKYALNGLFAIDDTKDADATNDHGKVNTEEKFTPENKSIQSMLFTRLNQCKNEGEILSFIDEYTKQIESLPKEMSEIINEQIEIRLDCMKRGVPLKEVEAHGFAGVNDAISWMKKMKPVVDGFKSSKMLIDWQKNNQPFINGLECLNAEKYKVNGKSPKERMMDELAKKLDELTTIETTQTPIG